MIIEKTLKRIKLIVFDLDGTLLNERNEIGSKTKELVQELKQMGVKFSFASGRLHSAITDHAETLGITTPLISLDGSLIKNYPQGDVIFESFVPWKYVKKAINLAEDNLLRIAVCQPDSIVFTEDHSIIPELLDKFGAKFTQIEEYVEYFKSALEIVMVADHREQVKHLAKKMTFPFAFGLDVSYYKSQREHGLYYLEIRKNGCSKGKGLKRLARHLKISIEDTAVAGDWYNDRTLFETKAFKVAMKNAVPEIIYKSDMVTEKDNTEDGIAEFLEKVYNAKKK